MGRIKVVLPVPVAEPDTEAMVLELMRARRRVATEGTELAFVAPRRAHPALATLDDRLLSARTLRPALSTAAAQGFDAVVVDCTCDQFADVRCYNGVPVVSAFLAGLLCARCLGDRTAVVTPNLGQSVVYEHLISLYRFERHVLAVSELLDSGPPSPAGQDRRPAPPANRQQAWLEALAATCEVLLGKISVDSIVLGCTGFTRELELQDRVGVPVIGPGGAALKHAEALITLGPDTHGARHVSTDIQGETYEFDRVEEDPTTGTLSLSRDFVERHAAE
jgi:Asp/Glu/hydantoin racemase